MCIFKFVCLCNHMQIDNLNQLMTEPGGGKSSTVNYKNTGFNFLLHLTDDLPIQTRMD